jgi:prepilin-type processing-associated H-X9-DG protein
VVFAPSRNPGGVNVALVDGAVRFVKDQVEANFRKSMGTIADADMIFDHGY